MKAKLWVSEKNGVVHIFKVTNKPKGGAMSKQEDDGATRIYGAKSKNEGKVVGKQKKKDMCIFIKYK